jgi:PadR family transcriptional regulator PadR
MESDGLARDWLAQLRRGLIELCVLALIDRRPSYGYELATALAGFGTALSASEGTLYPLLRRLQREGLVDATWQESRDGPPRKYYHLSAAGRRVLESQLGEWDELTRAMAQIRALDEPKNEDKEVPANGTASQRRNPALSGRAAPPSRPPAAS